MSLELGTEAALQSLLAIISKTKARTLDLYNQNILHNDRLQNSFKKLNELSEPFLSKYSATIQAQIETVLQKLVLHKDDFQLLQKISEARERFIALGERVLVDAEARVEAYYKTLELKEVKGEKVQESQVCLGPRVQNLIVMVNAITRFWAANLVKQLPNLKMNAKVLKFVLEHAQDLNLVEKLGDVKVLMELGQEYLNTNLQPKVNGVKVWVQETSKNVVLVVEGLKQKGVTELLNEAKDKIKGISEVTVETFKTKVLVKLNKEELMRLGDNSRKALLEIVEKIKATDFKEAVCVLKEKGTEKSKELYQRALERLQKGKEEYLRISKLVQERKMERETAKQKDLVEDRSSKSTEHKSDSDHEIN